MRDRAAVPIVSGMSMRPLALVLPLLLAAACANPTQEEATQTPTVEADGTDPAALGSLDPSVGLDGPVVAEQCLYPEVDVTKQLTLGPMWWSTIGTANVAMPCDRYVVEVTGIIGAHEVVLESSSNGAFPVVGNQANCEASTISANVRGEVPARWIWVNGQIKWEPAHWETIATKVEHGEWISAGNCRFAHFMQGTRMGIPGGQINDSIYSRIRVATKALFKTPGGLVTHPVKTRAVWYQ